MIQKLLKINQISKKYNERIILKDLSFEITSGTFTTLLGANGSGKSTLMRLMAGSEFPDTGEVEFKGYATNAWDSPVKRDVFYINENINIESSLNCEKFVQRFRNLFPNWHEKFFQSMIKDRRLDLKKNYNQFSRGQKMQFNLMIALAASPELLLLDEITSVMDVYARRYFLGLLHRYCQSGKTVVMTTNIISELQFYTTHLLLIHNSKLKLQGPLEEVAGGFVKLRFPQGSDHPLLKRGDLLWSGVNGDGSENFLLAREIAESLEIPSEFIDRRELTLEDIFIFHYSDTGGDLENAA
jgi:ABC-2 type transport system ATP-binding protein